MSTGDRCRVAQRGQLLDVISPAQLGDRRGIGPAPGGSMRPSVNSVHLPAAVDVEGGAGDVLGTVGGEEGDHLAEVARRLEAVERDAVAEVVPALLDGLAMHG